jgi:WhiB family redox-sensing transcriptional regulator
VPEIPPRPGDEHVAPGLDVDELLAVVGIERPSWMRSASCRGTDVDTFYVSRSGASRFTLDEARRLCEVCPVRGECLDHAISTGEKHGLWGGLSVRQRQAERRRRRREPAPP